MVYLCGRPLRNRGRCTLGRETAIQKMVWGATAGCAPWTEREFRHYRRRRAAPCAAARFPPARRARGLRRARACRSISNGCASPWPEELFSLTERPGYLRLYGRETHRQPVPAVLVARRQQSHCLQRRDGRRVRAGAFPADGRTGLLLQQREVSLPLRLARREFGKHLRVMSCLPDQVQTDAFRRRSAFPRGRRSICAWRWISSGCISRIAWKAGSGRGCPDHSMPASCPTRQPLRERRISRAHSSAWRARTWPAPAVRRISTISSTANVVIVPTHSARTRI